MKNLNLSTILLILLVFSATWQLKSCFEPKQVDEKLIRAQVKLEQYEKDLPVIRQELDVIYAKYDSLLLASVQRYEALENKKQPIKNAIKQVPVIVSNFDKEQLRRAVANY